MVDDSKNTSCIEEYKFGWNSQRGNLETVTFQTDSLEEEDVITIEDHYELQFELHIGDIPKLIKALQMAQDKINQLRDERS